MTLGGGVGGPTVHHILPFFDPVFFFFGSNAGSFLFLAVGSGFGRGGNGFTGRGARA